MDIGVSRQLHRTTGSRSCASSASVIPCKQRCAGLVCRGSSEGAHGDGELYLPLLLAMSQAAQMYAVSRQEKKRPVWDAVGFLLLPLQALRGAVSFYLIQVHDLPQPHISTTSARRLAVVANALRWCAFTFANPPSSLRAHPPRERFSVHRLKGFHAGKYVRAAAKTAAAQQLLNPRRQWWRNSALARGGE